MIECVACSQGHCAFNLPPLCMIDASSFFCFFVILCCGQGGEPRVGLYGRRGKAVVASAQFSVNLRFVGMHDGTQLVGTFCPSTLSCHPAHSPPVGQQLDLFSRFLQDIFDLLSLSGPLSQVRLWQDVMSGLIYKVLYVHPCNRVKAMGLSRLCYWEYLCLFSTGAPFRPDASTVEGVHPLSR